VMKKQLGDTLQFYACILGTAEQGGQYRVSQKAAGLGNA